MNKLIFTLVILFFLNNCSFNENSRIWKVKEKKLETDKKITKVFSEDKASVTEFNQDLKLDLSSIKIFNKKKNNLNNSGLQIQYFKPEIGCGDENALNYDSNTTLGYDFNNECNYPTPESADEFTNVDGDSEFLNYPYRYDAVVNGGLYWDGSTIERTYSEDNSVGQIFINDNKDIILSQNCKLEFNTGNITDKTIYDSSGNSNKGLIIGDYKIKKAQKNEQMRRDSYIKTPIRTKENGAL